MRKRLKIAIDGPAGAGKSTVAKMVADALGYLYIDTGAMYRAVALLVDRKGIPIEDEESISKMASQADIRLLPAEHDSGQAIRVFANGEEVTTAIRADRISQITSPISTFPAVRKRLVALQQTLAQEGGVVLDGRDIGTVVMPDAEVKIFLTASAEERARRRHLELQQSGKTADLEAILKSINERDERDSTRAISPLRCADDAYTVNTDGMTIDEVKKEILEIWQKKAAELK